MIIELAAYRAARARRMCAIDARDELLCVNWPDGAVDVPRAQACSAPALVTDDLPHAELAALCRNAYVLATQI